MSDWSDLMTSTMDVVRPGDAVDELGARVDADEPIARNVPCRVVLTSSRSTEQGRERDVGDRTVYADAPLDVRAGDRLVIDGARYSVVSVGDPSGEDEVLEIAVRRL